MISDIAKEQIKAHAIKTYPRECCGFVVVTPHGKELVVPCVNSHRNPYEYVRCSAEEQSRVEAIGEKLCFYHSHPNESALMTDADKASSELMDLPWVCYAHPLDQWSEYQPEGWIAPLVGRQFVHGIHDCYTICRDYYRFNLAIELPDFEREDGWWEQPGRDLYLENFEKAGFVRVNDLKKHDGILMEVGKTLTVNHAAIYLGGNIMIHHFYNRLSVRAPYGGMWLKNTRMIVRHKSLC